MMLQIFILLYISLNFYVCEAIFSNLSVPACEDTLNKDRHREEMVKNIRSMPRDAPRR